MECRSGWPGALGRAGAPPMRSTGAVSQAGSWLLSGISFQRFINPSDREASRCQVLPEVVKTTGPLAHCPQGAPGLRGGPSTLPHLQPGIFQGADLVLTSLPGRQRLESLHAPIASSPRPAEDFLGGDVQAPCQEASRVSS